MSNLNFFSVLRSNLKCAFCRNKNCRVRYYPNRKRYQYAGGTRFVDTCQKDIEKIRNRKLP